MGFVKTFLVAVSLSGALMDESINGDRTPLYNSITSVQEDPFESAIQEILTLGSITVAPVSLWKRWLSSTVS